MSKQKINASRLFELHLKVLTQLIRGKSFKQISQDLHQEFESLNYIKLSKDKMLSFDDKDNLIGAYPISPKKTNYKVTIDGIGTGYSMCAIDSIGVAFTFNKTTKIETRDHSNDKPLTFTIDPNNLKINYNILISYKKVKNSQSCNSATEVCPFINFYSTDSISKVENMSIIPFEKALESAKSQFSKEALTNCFEAILKKSTFKVNFPVNANTQELNEKL